MKGNLALEDDDHDAEGAVANALSPKQELALQAVIAHATIKEAALAAGVSETTLWRYMQNEAFSQRLRDVRREAVNHAVIRLQKSSSDAVTVLHNLMLKEEAPASSRISAARVILDYNFRVIEMDELRKRIEELEDYIKLKQEVEALQIAADEDEDKE